jgi:two-component system, OmpR family, sensor kinase
VTLFARLWPPLALLFAGLVLLLGAGEYRTLQRALRSEIDHNLEKRANWVASELRAGRQPQGWMVPGDHPLEELAKLFVEISDGQGRLLAASANLGSSRIPGIGQAGYSNVQTEEGSRLRVYQLELDQPRRTIRVAESLELAERSLQSTGLRALAVGTLVTVLTALLLRFVLHRSLRPLEQLAEVAQNIVKTGNTGIRAPIAGASQETAQVAQALNGLLDRVDELLRAQQQLLQDTSHELRNPLTVLKMDLDVLARGDLDEATRDEVAQEARGELSRLVRLVEDLLLISWAEGRPPLQLQTVELGEVLSGVLERYRQLAPDRQFSVVGESVAVRVDAMRLEQILRNLLDNAVRYTAPQGKISLWILGENDKQAPVEKKFLIPTVETSPERVVVVVQDDGCGIAPEHWESLFVRFYRLENDRNRKVGGTGLGLPLARALARAMDGDLWVYSQPGRGSSFLLALPKSG